MITLQDEEYEVTKKEGVSLFINRKDIKRLKEEYPDSFFQEFGIVIAEKGLKLRRWEHKEERERVQTFISYDGLDSLLRFLGKHYPDKQKEELGNIEEWQRRIYLLNMELEEWKSLSEAEKETISNGLVSVANEMPDPAYAKDEDKQEARRNLLYASDFRDKRGRINPCAMRAKISKADYGNLEDRIGSLERIRFNYEVAGLFLKGLRFEYKKKFMLSRQRLKAMKDGFENEVLNSRTLKNLRKKVVKEFASLEKVKVPPYKNWVKDLKNLLFGKFENAKDKKTKLVIFDEGLDLVTNVIDHIEEEEKKLR